MGFKAVEPYCDPPNNNLLQGIMTVDELRRGIETIIPEQYESMLYHEKWIHSLETLLTEKGLITRKELDSATEKVKEKWG